MDYGIFILIPTLIVLVRAYDRLRPRQRGSRWSSPPSRRSPPNLCRP